MLEQRKLVRSPSDAAALPTTTATEYGHDARKALRHRVHTDALRAPPSSACWGACWLQGPEYLRLSISFQIEWSSRLSVPPLNPNRCIEALNTSRSISSSKCGSSIIPEQHLLLQQQPQQPGQQQQQQGATARRQATVSVLCWDNLISLRTFVIPYGLEWIFAAWMRALPLPTSSYYVNTMWILCQNALNDGLSLLDHVTTTRAYLYPFQCFTTIYMLMCIVFAICSKDVRAYFYSFLYFYILLHTCTYFNILFTYFVHLLKHTFTYLYILVHAYTYFCILLHTFAYFYILVNTFAYFYKLLHTFTCIYILLHTFTYFHIRLHTATYLYILLPTRTYLCIL